MPERDPDDLLEAFENVTAYVPRPSIPSENASVVPRIAVATLLVIVLAAVAGAAFVYGPRLVPASGPDSVALPTHRDLDADSVALPTHRDLDAYPAALLFGRLVLDGPCLYVQPYDSDMRDLVVWPRGMTLVRSGDEEVLTDGSGKRVATIGEPVDVGGGEVSRAYMQTLLETEIPAECSALFWLASDVRSPLAGYVPATWRLLPLEPVTPATTTLNVVLTEQECANGLTPEGRIGAPDIKYGDVNVVITVPVRRFGGADCPSNPEYQTTIELSEPIGERLLVDGSDNTIRWQHRVDTVALPQTQRPSNVFCYPTYLEGAFLAGSPDDPSVAWVVSDEGQRVNVLWPAGFTARFGPEIELIDPIGQVFARSGDLLTLGGGFAAGEFDTCEVHLGPLDIGGDPLPWPNPRGSTPPAPTDEPGSHEPPTTNPPSSDSPFIRVDDFIEGDEQVSSVAAGGPGYVAVGWKTLPGDQCVEGRVWTSQDGRHWSRQETEMAPNYLEEVIEFGGEVYAFGHENVAPGCSAIGDGTIWRSTDGVQWSLAAALPNAHGRWMDVAVTESRLFAVSASSAYGTWTWVTSDGSEWQQSGEQTPVAHHLGILGRTVVVAGEPYDTDVTGLDAKVSTDEGASWQDVSIDFDFWFEPSFAEHDGILLAATHTRSSESAPDQGIAMTTRDGFDWTIAAPNLAPAYAAVAIPDGFVTIANDGSTAISADGLTWFVGPHLPQVDDRQFPQEATAGATGLLIVATDYRNVVEYDRRLWFAPLDSLSLSNWTTPVALVE
jgi:hypothetical protein